MIIPLINWGQKVGDSIEITSYSNRIYNGKITTIDPDGYFLKTYFNIIFISNREIKEYQLFKLQKQLEKENDIINKVIQDSSEYHLNEYLIEDEYSSAKISLDISGWYGLPDFGTNVFRTINMGSGPYGFTGEVIFKNPLNSFGINLNDIGIGVDYIYRKRNYVWPYRFKSTRVHLRINYFTNQFISKKIKQYYGFGVGISFEEYANNPFIVYYRNHTSFRFCYGIKYCISKKIKLGAEIGLGGSTLRGIVQISPFSNSLNNSTEINSSLKNLENDVPKRIPNVVKELENNLIDINKLSSKVGDEIIIFLKDGRELRGKIIKVAYKIDIFGDQHKVIKFLNSNKKMNILTTDIKKVQEVK